MITEQGSIVQGTDKSRAKPWFLPQRPYGVSIGQEATGGDRHGQGSAGKSEAFPQGVLCGCADAELLLPASERIREFTGLQSSGLGPKSCKPWDGGRGSPAPSPAGLNYTRIGQAGTSDPSVLGPRGMRERVSVGGSAEPPSQDAHMYL